MSSQIIAKINSFVKKRLIELVGISLILFSFFLITIVFTYFPEDPNFIIQQDDTKIKNVGGFYGSAISDFFLQAIGLIFILLVLTILSWGFSLIKNKNIENFIPKIFYILIYTISGTVFINVSFNESHLLVYHGNGGFVGRIITENIYSFLPTIHDDYLVYSFTLVTIIFFFLSLSLKLNEIKIILLFPFNILKKILVFLFKNKKDEFKTEISVDDTEAKNIETASFNQKQPILPFLSKKETNLKKNDSNFKVPSIIFLKKNIDLKNKKNIDENELTKNSEFLEKILLDFGVEGKIKRISCGPVVTLNEFEPASGIKVSKIVNLADDIARNTSSISTRVATIPGKNTIGIEIPNPKRENVFLSEIISDERFDKKEIKLPIALGKSISGTPIVADLSKMPHLLIAGTTGSGKSVCINTVILSLLYKYTPEKCNLILIDPKMLELSAYEGIPHLLCPVITEAKKATAALGWAVKEMESIN